MQWRVRARKFFTLLVEGAGRNAATGASKPAGAPVQTVTLGGQISAIGKGTKGGTVVVTGENIVLSGVAIDASGDAGGGKVLIGGDTGGGHPSAAAAGIELAKLEEEPLLRDALNRRRTQRCSFYVPTAFYTPRRMLTSVHPLRRCR